jgi:quinol monooxygenase YgiN
VRTRLQINQIQRPVAITHRKGRFMPIISKGNDCLTFINVFTVAPEKQQALIELLTQATTGSVRHAPGFISASLHRSLDGTKVTMYAQWRDLAAYEAMRKDPAPLPFLQQALAIAKFEPGTYEVVDIFDSSKAQPGG